MSRLYGGIDYSEIKFYVTMRVSAYTLIVLLFRFGNSIHPSCKQCLDSKQSSSALTENTIRHQTQFVINPHKPGVPAASDQGLHCLLTGISIENRIKINKDTTRPYNWKWTRPIDMDGRVH